VSKLDSVPRKVHAQDLSLVAISLGELIDAADESLTQTIILKHVVVSDEGYLDHIGQDASMFEGFKVEASLAKELKRALYYTWINEHFENSQLTLAREEEG
jgi:hypothetical protein